MVLYTNEQHRDLHKALRNTKVQGRFCWFLVDYEDVLFPIRKVSSKPIQGCTTNAKVTFEAREKNFMVCCVKCCREIQKQENQNVVIIEGREKIVEYTLCPDR